MFISDRFVYLELHKTGCTHIRNILKDLLDGELVGKHNQANRSLFEGEKIFLGSVRDPWEWYTSLWSFGCDNKGTVFTNTTKHQISIRGLGWRRNPFAAFLRLIAFRSRNPQAWKDTYTNVNDFSAFREWLLMMHDERFISDIGEPYSRYSLSRVAGLMTFRYLMLFCTKFGKNNTLKSVSTIDQIIQYEQDNCFINYFIRNENLEADLFQILEENAVEIPLQFKSNVLLRPKTNASSRVKGTGYYYDAQTADLVAEKERLIVEKFGYTSPDIKTLL